jgi:hypothetical protein
MKTTLISVVVAALAAAAFAASAAQSAPAGCVAGVKKINGVSARTFCGPAKATVKLGSSTVKYAGGECSKSSFGWTINIGTVVLGNLKKKPEYFGITVTPAKAGSHARSGPAIVHSSTSYAVLGTVTLKAGLKSGTFSGKAFGSPQKISGSFTC